MSTNPDWHLPLDAYVSNEWFEREQRQIFERCWQFVGFVEDIREPGDYITVQAGRYPLFVVKGLDGELRAFHNICRHRGTQLLRTSGNTKKVITCPYHDWAYSIDGELLTVPEQSTEFPNLDKGRLCLHGASVDSWKSMLFVHPEPKAQPLTDWFDGLDPYIGPHIPESLDEHVESQMRYEIAANWKIVVENYIDGYHLAHLHSSTLNMYDHRHQKSRFIGPHFMFYEPLTPNYLAQLQKRSPLPLIDHIPRERLGAYVPLLFPNLGLSATESTWSTFHVQPVAPDKTIVETRTRVPDASSWSYLKQGLQSYLSWPTQSTTGDPGDPLESGDFMLEDIHVCEQQQRAMNSPKFDMAPPGVDLERSVTGFRKLVKDYLHQS